MVATADRLAIGELIADYGHLVDDRDWDRVGDLFTDDVVYDMTDFDMGVVVGPDAVVEMWTGPTAAPLAHHATNIVIREDTDGTVHVRSKGIGMGR